MDYIKRLNFGHFGESTELLPSFGSAQLHTEVFPDNELPERLRTEIRWGQQHIVLFNKRVAEPRLSAWYGDPGTIYTYSGLRLEPLSWTPTLLTIKSVCESLADTKFNSVLANLYRDGSDSMGWHSDDEPELGLNPTIASVSFGTERRFDFRHKDTKETIRTFLPSGSVLVMSGQTQTHWMHQVAKTKKVHSARINLTFRYVQPSSTSHD